MAGIDFIVLAHTNPAQVRRLLRRVAPIATAVYLHVDAPRPQEFAAGAEVTLLRSRRAPWGRFGVVDATLDGLRAFVENGSGASHVVLLSGADYPIKPPEVIADFFWSEPDTTFLASGRMPRPEWLHGGMSRINRYHFAIAGRALALPPTNVMPQHSFRRFPRGLTPFGGSAYWAMSRSCAEHVVRFDAERPEVARFYRRTRSPDELFFHTIVMNSPHAERVRHGGVHYVDWSRGGAHPARLGIRDIPALTRSPMLFARKFSDETVLDELDAALG